jgi:hypothetical protein
VPFFTGTYRLHLHLFLLPASQVPQRRNLDLAQLCPKLMILTSGPSPSTLLGTFLYLPRTTILHDSGAESGQVMPHQFSREEAKSLLKLLLQMTMMTFSCLVLVLVSVRAGKKVWMAQGTMHLGGTRTISSPVSEHQTLRDLFLVGVVPILVIPEEALDKMVICQTRRNLLATAMINGDGMGVVEVENLGVGALEDMEVEVVAEVEVEVEVEDTTEVTIMVVAEAEEAVEVGVVDAEDAGALVVLDNAGYLPVSQYWYPFVIATLI